ncbi:MAG: dicarboxylate/amino acid:cation symporter, partial [Gammaproteobacteria bacterium]|nr:dicarboxylate/amino acid:cation symporter [Gammaproteobacteria bacterium]
MNRISTVYNDFLGRIEKYIAVLSILAFATGCWLANLSEGFARQVDGIVNSFIDGYGMIAPTVIYLILTPSLTKVFTSIGKGGKGFVARMMIWFAGTRLIALLWAVLFTTVVFDLPWISQDTSSFSQALSTSMGDLGWLLTHSVYFYAIYASLISVTIALKVDWLAGFFSRGVDLIEYMGSHLVLLVPVFMLGIGSYVAYLPSAISSQVEASFTDQAVSGNLMGSGIELHPIEVLGMGIDPGTSTGMIMAYLLGALLTGLACVIWHAALLGVAKRRIRDFSITDYFKNYWVKVYPLLWSTSSEALSTPLNLHLVKRHYPRITPEIRGFTIGGGSFLGINGTVICVYALGGLVTSILGIEVSFLQLLMSIPLIFLLGYGIPGIPGELIIFAGPIAIILGLPQDVVPVFLALYVGFQIGLPDSFRTG